MDLKYGYDRFWDCVWEVYRDRDCDRDYEREKVRWDRFKEWERVRLREKDWGRERD